MVSKVAFGQTDFTPIAGLVQGEFLRWGEQACEGVSRGDGGAADGIGPVVLIESRSKSPIAAALVAERMIFLASGSKARRTPRRVAHQRQADRSQEAVCDPEGRHCLAQHAAATAVTAI